MLHPESSHIDTIAAALGARFGGAPPVAIVLGSGLGAVAQAVIDPRRVPTTEVGLPPSTVPGHAGTVVRGTLAGVETLVLSGRVHLYEGHPTPTVVRGIRALHRWGVQKLILTCSVGGIAETFDPGTLVLITDHINLMGRTPLAGPAYGTRFPDMAEAYHPGMRARFRSAAVRRGIRLAEGVLAAMPGPAYETPAEIRMLQRLGADIVGMSTVPEVLAAAELNMPCVAVALVSNRAAGLTPHKLHHEEVTTVAQQAGASLRDLLLEVVPEL